MTNATDLRLVHAMVTRQRQIAAAFARSFEATASGRDRINRSEVLRTLRRNLSEDVQSIAQRIELSAFLKRAGARTVKHRGTYLLTNIRRTDSPKTAEETERLTRKWYERLARETDFRDLETFRDSVGRRVNPDATPLRHGESVDPYDYIDTLADGIRTATATSERLDAEIAAAEINETTALRLRYDAAVWAWHMEGKTIAEMSALSEEHFGVGRKAVLKTIERLRRLPASRAHQAAGRASAAKLHGKDKDGE